jgi:predicted transcriptional regulator
MGSVRLSREIDEKARRVAALKGLSLSEVYRRALEQYCDRELAAARQSRFDDVIGVAEGPADLAERASEYFVDLLAERRG